MRISKFLIHAVLLFTVPTLPIYPQIDSPTIGTPFHVTDQDLLQDDRLLAYDDLLNFIDDIEDGEFEKRYGVADLERINLFLASVAKQGILPNEFEEEFVLDNDIDDLLNGEDTQFEFSFSYKCGSDYVFVPAVLNNHGEFVLCKSWFHKKWDRTKKFVKKHKKAIIIGVAVIVATIAVVGVVAAVSTASAAAAGAAASKDKANGNQATPTPADPSEVLNAANEAPILNTIIGEHTSAFKEIVAEENLLQSSKSSISQDDPKFGRTVRELGAILAHETLDGVSELASIVPQLMEEIKEIGHRFLPESLLSDNSGVEITPIKNFDQEIAIGHEKIDQVFSTNQAGQYSAEAKEVGDKYVTGILPPPSNISKGINPSKFKEAIITRQEKAVLSRELELSSRELTGIENAGQVEGRVNNVAKDILKENIPPNYSRNVNFTEHALTRAAERGVSQESIFDALDSPLKIEEIRIDHLGRPSQRFIGMKAEVVVNPDTQQIVSVNPTSTKKAEKLINGILNADN